MKIKKFLILSSCIAITSVATLVSSSCKDNDKPKKDELETLLSKVEIDIKEKANIDPSAITLTNIK
ncbi:hypothetical protein, partial [Mycoplasmopsis primatum]|uniref:hypothetical protein n=1 Tax=Mycoplasmopsis primatum TaxID=55604 RepID=UPI000565BABA